jgi:hypothetical protein
MQSAPRPNLNCRDDYSDWPSPQGERGKKKRLPLGDWKAEGRAFVPVDRDGFAMLHRLGLTPYHDVGTRTLQQQLDLSKPSTATRAERMQRNSAEQ